jgi:predicted choloylglycine hydrolase
MRRSPWVVLLLAVGSALLLPGCAVATSSSALRPLALAAPTAPPEEPLPVPVVTLEGSGSQIGRKHGRELCEQIQTLEEKYLNRRLGDQSKRMIAYTAASLFATKIAPQHMQEISGIAETSGLEQRTVLLAQCFLDLTNSVACSTIALPASAAPDGVARMGRNLDFPSLGVADKLSVVMIYKPIDAYEFVAVGWPGLVGVLSGMNEHGLTLANMEVNRAPRFPSAMPYPLLYRTILEKCRTVDEAIALLQNTPRQSANNLMLMDAAGNRAVVEIKPESIAVRRGVEDQPLISTNHQRGQDQTTPGRCWRYDSLHAAATASFGQVDVAKIESMLNDAQQKNFTIQSMVFEPSRRVVYLAFGTNAASTKFYRFDLNRHFTSALPVAMEH